MIEVALCLTLLILLSIIRTMSINNAKLNNQQVALKKDLQKLHQNIDRMYNKLSSMSIPAYDSVQVPKSVSSIPPPPTRPQVDIPLVSIDNLMNELTSGSHKLRKTSFLTPNKSRMMTRSSGAKSIVTWNDVAHEAIGKKFAAFNENDR